MVTNLSVLFSKRTKCTNIVIYCVSLMLEGDEVSSLQICHNSCYRLPAEVLQEVFEDTKGVSSNSYKHLHLSNHGGFA